MTMKITAAVILLSAMSTNITGYAAEPVKPNAALDAELLSVVNNAA